MRARRDRPHPPLNFGRHSLLSKCRDEGITGVGLVRIVLGFDRYVPPSPVSVASLAAAMPLRSFEERFREAFVNDHNQWMMTGTHGTESRALLADEAARGGK